MFNVSKFFKKYAFKALGHAYYEKPMASFDILDSLNSYNDCTDNGYAGNVIVFRSINLVATSVASVPISLYQQTVNGEKVVIDTHELVDLARFPSRSTSWSEFVESIISYFFMHGNAYILMSKDQEGFVRCMHVLKPDKVDILIDDTTGEVEEYIYMNSADSKLRFKVDPLTGESNVIHMKRFNPANQVYGLSTLRVAMNNVRQYNAAGDWNYSVLNNSARPSGAFVANYKNGNGGTLSVEQYNRLKEQINQYYVGAQNAGRPILLEGGLEWKEMSLSPKDMDFLAIKNSNARDISLAFGVPPQLLGIPGDNTYSNLLEARVSLWEQTVLPLLDQLLGYLNYYVVRYVDSSLAFGYDKNSVDILVKKREGIWKNLINAEFITDNEKRQAFGLPSNKSA